MSALKLHACTKCSKPFWTSLDLICSTCRSACPQRKRSLNFLCNSNRKLHSPIQLPEIRTPAHVVEDLVHHIPKQPRCNDDSEISHLHEEHIDPVKETEESSPRNNKNSEDEVENENEVKILDAPEDDLDDDEPCLVCGECMQSLSSVERETHINNCLDSLEADVSGVRVTQRDCSTSVTGEDGEGNPRHVCHEDSEGLRSRHFLCVVCGLDISRRGLLPRCQHLKRCARLHGVATKELLQMIAPVLDEADEEEEEEDAEDEDELEDNGVLLEHGEVATATAGGVSEPAAIKKNAFDMLLAGSRSAALSGGFKADESEKGKAKEKEKAERRKSTGNAPGGSSSNQNRGMGSGQGRRSSMGSGRAAVDGRDVDNYGNGRFRAGGKTGTVKRGFGRWGSKRSSESKNSNQYAPPYKLIKVGAMQVPIVVDGFQYASASLSDCYFLTHFHADHYIGLDKDFDCGTVYCSPTTAGLVRLKLRLQGPNRVVPLALEKLHTISVGGVKVEVVFLEANHCPGAVCILFKFENGKKVLHTGDFRWSPELLRSPVYHMLSKSVVNNSRNLSVYLDTTYCDPSHDFPPQQDTIEAIVSCVKAELGKPDGRQCLFVFGAYGIGKERVYMSVAAATGMKVCVEKTRWKSMMCYDWSAQELARLTTDHNATNLFVVPMAHINFNHLMALKKKKACNRVVAFQPTGWTHTPAPNGNGKSASTSSGAMNSRPDGGEVCSEVNKENLSGSYGNGNTDYIRESGCAQKSKPASSASSASSSAAGSGIIASLLRPRKKGDDVIYAVPYSEHSSFSELVLFIKTFRPQRIIPTVNTSQEKVKEQVLLLREHAGADEEPIEHHPQPLHKDQQQQQQQHKEQQSMQVYANTAREDDGDTDENHHGYSELSVNHFLGVDMSHSRTAPSEFF